MSGANQEIDNPQSGPKWRVLDRYERRVAGVLVEKAKTTPDNYPLSLNALVNGCNQKNNRSPQMQLDEEQVSEALDRLRGYGAVVVVQGDGRVEKYRHLMYEWLGVDKAELAVMAELLLRGEQTLGDLRARAARMEPIPGQAELQPIVDSLKQKGLLIYLTPPGRGSIVTHSLYHEQELTKIRSEVASGSSAAGEEPRSVPTWAADGGPSDELRQEISELKQRLSAVEERLAEVTRQLGV